MFRTLLVLSHLIGERTRTFILMFTRPSRMFSTIGYSIGTFQKLNPLRTSEIRFSPRKCTLKSLGRTALSQPLIFRYLYVLLRSFAVRTRQITTRARLSPLYGCVIVSVEAPLSQSTQNRRGPRVKSPNASPSAYRPQKCLLPSSCFLK